MEIETSVEAQPVGFRCGIGTIVLADNTFKHTIYTNRGCALTLGRAHSNKREVLSTPKCGIGEPLIVPLSLSCKCIFQEPKQLPDVAKRQWRIWQNFMIPMATKGGQSGYT